jgi:hypothetical protein
VRADPRDSERPAPVFDVPDRTTSAAGGRVWVATVTAGLLVSALSWLAGESVIRSIPTQTDQANVNGRERSIVTVLSSHRTEVKRATLAYGLQGALLGICLGLAGASMRWSVGGGTVAALVGLIIGAGAGAGASGGLFPVFLRHLDPISGDLLGPMITHAAIWSALGAAGGLAFGIGRVGRSGDIVRAVLGGLTGAALGAIAFQLVGAFCFPQSKTDMPLAAEPPARLLALALTCLSTAAGVAISARPTKSPQERPQHDRAGKHEPLTA